MAKAKDLKTRFREEIAPKLQKELGIKNILALPKLEKITVNVGMGTYIKNHNKDFSNITENITAITGQKPTINKARIAVSNFKVREGDPIGISATLRGERMYDFIEKLVNIVFPRVRDFRGIPPKAFDGQGNYSVGFKEHTVFPEINPDDILKPHGLQVVISTTAKDNDQGRALLTALGFPFKK